MLGQLPANETCIVPAHCKTSSSSSSSSPPPRESVRGVRGGDRDLGGGRRRHGRRSASRSPQRDSPRSPRRRSRRSLSPAGRRLPRPPLLAPARPPPAPARTPLGPARPPPAPAQTPLGPARPPPAPAQVIAPARVVAPALSVGPARGVAQAKGVAPAPCVAPTPGVGNGAQDRPTNLTVIATSCACKGCGHQSLGGQQRWTGCPQRCCRRGPFMSCRWQSGGGCPQHLGH
jgi:hypothetical protein